MPIRANRGAAHAKAVASPEILKKLHDADIDPVAGAPAAFARHIDGETARWKAVIRERSIKAE